MGGILKDASAQPDLTGDQCTKGACIIIQHDNQLAEEALKLKETLSLRLCNLGVQVLMETPPEASMQEEVGAVPTNAECTDNLDHKIDRVWWTIHLRQITSEYVFIAVDHLGPESDEDLVREVLKGPDAGATAWTIALMIESTVVPYLESNKDLAPVGAGLAIIEPLAVGGIKKPEPHSLEAYPKLRCLGLGVTMYYVGAVNDANSDFLVGPRIIVQGLLGPRFVAYFSAGWVGTGNFDSQTGEVKGKMTHVPIDLSFGFNIFSRHFVSMTLFSGISAGFSVFQTTSTSSNKQRVDMYFDPWVQHHLEITVHVYGPLAVYFSGGAAFPIVRDVLKNDNIEVYRQDWVMPQVDIGLQLWI